jgi:alkaline phosphatase D
MPDEGQFDRIGRRSFLAAAAGGVVAAGLLRDEQAGPQAAAAPVGPLPTNVTRTWIGPPYWANRLQDWRLNQGRLECLTGTTATRGRTVAVLTRELVAGNLAAQLTVRTGTLARGSTGGFSGFLVGAGGGALDHRAAALVQGASGTGGGLLCTYDSDGRVKFRDHSGESNQFGYPILPAATESGPRPARTLAEDVELRLDIAPLGGDAFRLTLTAVNFASGAVLATAVLNNVAGSRLRGGIALISSCRDASAGARYWFRDLATSGPKVVEQPGRAVGPILGTMWSLNGSVLKLTAQFLPIGASEPQQAQLQYRLPGGAWLNGPTVTIGDGWTALFRLAGWDGTRDWEYRVAYAAGTPAQHLYGGTIARDPVAKSRIVVGVLNCFIHSYRPLDSGSSGAALLPGSQTLGLYTDRNLYFPNQALAANLASQQPDLLVAMGDQYYEHRPTREDTSANRTLDMVYRWSLWLWSFRDLTRDRPTIVLVDDHDVYHPNLWGHSGAAAPNGDYHLGGYAQAGRLRQRPPARPVRSQPGPVRREPRPPGHHRLLREVPVRRRQLRGDRGPQVQDRRLRPAGRQRRPLPTRQPGPPGSAPGGVPGGVGVHGRRHAEGLPFADAVGLPADRRQRQPAQ